MVPDSAYSVRYCVPGTIELSETLSIPGTPETRKTTKKLTKL